MKKNLALKVLSVVHQKPSNILIFLWFYSEIFLTKPLQMVKISLITNLYFWIIY